MRRELVCAAAATAGAYVLVARPWHLRWGTTDAERRATLPGDALLPGADLVATRAITVDAPAVHVWPWIAQLGQGRGGFYSYDALENLVGCDIRSAERIVAEWQDPRAGDPFRLHPEVALEVAEVDPGRALVLRGGVPVGDAPPPYDFVWSFTVRPLTAGTTRLVVRERYGYHRRWAGLLVEPVEAVSFVMTRRMLKGVRARAEGLHRGAGAT